MRKQNFKQFDNVRVKIGISGATTKGYIEHIWLDSNKIEIASVVTTLPCDLQFIRTATKTLKYVDIRQFKMPDLIGYTHSIIQSELENIEWKQINKDFIKRNIKALQSKKIGEASNYKIYFHGSLYFLYYLENEEFYIPIDSDYIDISSIVD